MKTNNIHKFEFNSETEFIEIQNNLVQDIELKNSFDKTNIKYIAGVDLAYWEKNHTEYATCCIIVVDYHTKQVIEKVYSYGEITVPYVAGFLAFRELPLVLEAIKKLTTDPDIFMFDGNGFLHYNHMGIATHASFFINKPTIGVAKSYLKIKGVDFKMPENQQNAFCDIVIDKEIYGRVLRTKKDINPIFISCGNYIDLDTTTEIVTTLTNNDSKLPIPVRLADLETHIVREKLKY